MTALLVSIQPLSSPIFVNVLASFSFMCLTYYRVKRIASLFFVYPNLKPSSQARSLLSSFTNSSTKAEAAFFTEEVSGDDGLPSAFAPGPARHCEVSLLCTPPALLQLYNASVVARGRRTVGLTCETERPAVTVPSGPHISASVRHLVISSRSVASSRSLGAIELNRAG